MEVRKILVINPGATSTKIAVYINSKVIFLKNVKHKHEDLDSFKKIADQYEYRKNIVEKELKDADVNLELINVIMGRGGLVMPIKSGIYEVNKRMLDDVKATTILGEHASNLGAMMAYGLAEKLPNAKAYIVDPVVVDELQDVARITGHPEFERVSIFHALNQKAVCRMHAKSIGAKYEEMNIIVAHLGSGISVGAHREGQVVDVNNALNGEGPFSPERTGTLPARGLAKLCFSEKTTYDDVKSLIRKKGGMYAYLETNNVYEVLQRVKKGDKKAKLIFEAMAYQVAKEIGALGTVLKGKIDAIILTGGIAFNPEFVAYVKECVEHLGSVVVYPGEDEMEAMAMNGLMVLTGEAKANKYEPSLEYKKFWPIKD